MIFRGLKREYLKGLYGKGQGLLMMLDTDSILDSDEKIVVSKMKKKIADGVRKK